MYVCGREIYVCRWNRCMFVGGRHRRRTQGGEGGGHPSRFFGFTESLKSRSGVK